MRKLFTLISIFLMTGIVSAQYIYTDFDDNQNVEFTGWPNAPTAIANPDQSGINTSATVGEWVRSGEQWAHVYAELEEKINFNTGTTFSMKIWSPIACEVLFKLEDKTDNSIFVEVPASVESANEWVELSFDFSDAASDTYDKVVIFMDFSTMDDNTFYFDDIMGPNFSPSSVNSNIYGTAGLYPNPASDRILVKGVQLIERTEIFNTTGQLVIRQEGIQEAIDISGLQPGLYTVVIEDQKGELYLSKLIKE